MCQMPKLLTPVIPGQKLCKSDDQRVAGHGTYVRQGFVYSSLLGHLTVTENDKQQQTMTVEVKRGNEQNVVPTAGSVVTVRINSLNPRACKCSIICIEDTVLREPFRGQIRKEDVKATERDLVEIYNCFRPGDIVLARVLSLGDAHSYLLSTAEDELGVVIARSEAGSAMVPVSWTEMQCPKTYGKEFRKVAKVLPENFDAADVR